MSVTPSDFLECANALSASGDKHEMTLRNILSRAYYAAYHRACQFTPPNKSHDSDIGMHRSYHEQLLQNEKGSIERKIGEKLKTMYVRRITADYFLQDDIRHDAVPVQLYSSRELFKLLDTPLQPSESMVVVPLKRKD